LRSFEQNSGFYLTRRIVKTGRFPAAAVAAWLPGQAPGWFPEETTSRKDARKPGITTAKGVAGWTEGAGNL